MRNKKTAVVSISLRLPVMINLEVSVADSGEVTIHTASLLPVQHVTVREIEETLTSDNAEELDELAHGALGWIAVGDGD